MVLEPEGFAQQRASETRLVTMHLHDKFQHTVIPVNEGNEILVGYKPGFRSTSHHRDVELDESWGIFVCSFDGDLVSRMAGEILLTDHARPAGKWELASHRAIAGVPECVGWSDPRVHGDLLAGGVRSCWADYVLLG